MPSPTPFPARSHLPPLLLLPSELKLQVISYLGHDSSPNLACLRRTHRSFRNIIPKSDLRPKSPPFLLKSQLLDTELNHPYLLPVHHYPCYRCNEVLPADDFYPWMLELNVVGGECASKRFCLNCGFEWSTTEMKKWVTRGREMVRLQPDSSKRSPLDAL